MSAPPILTFRAEHCRGRSTFAALWALADSEDLPDGADLDLRAACALLNASSAALAACQQYDHWTREVRRLSGEIADTVCPRIEAHTNRVVASIFGDCEPPEGDAPESCFRVAASEPVSIGYGMSQDNYRTRRNLAEIAEVVADCPACSRLCRLIAERKHARQRLGVAKRAVRRAGRSS